MESSGSGGSGSTSGGRETRSSLSVESGGSGRGGGGGGGLNWTPPTGSVEGSTPTWTEGTPSFTESSSSGDMGTRNVNFVFFNSISYFCFVLSLKGCPTTPIRSGILRGEEDGRLVATVEEALASLTSEMVSWRSN